MNRTLQATTSFASSLLLILCAAHAVAAEPAAAAKPEPVTVKTPKPNPMPATPKPAPTVDTERETAALAERIVAYLESLPPVKLAVLCAAILALQFVLYVLSMQLACWFALVETTFARCAKLAVILGVVTLLTGMLSAVLLRYVQGGGDFAVLYFLLPAWLANPICCAYWTRQVLECRWRSVVTIFAMYHLSSLLMTTFAVAMALGIFLAFSVFA